MQNYSSPKKYKIGEVVYWIDKRAGQWKPEIKFGTVLDCYPGSVVLQLYEVPNMITIEGIRVKDFKTPTKWRKLPKGWTYDMQLIEYGTDKSVIPESCQGKVFNIKSKACLEELIHEGALIPAQDNDHSCFCTEITKEGWRIVRDYFNHEDVLTTISLLWDEVYNLYDDANATVLADLAELQRISELSDYDWSVEQIDKALDKLRTIMGYPEDRILQYREFLLSQDRVEDIEVRSTLNGLEWKYWKNKRWNRIVL